MEDDYSNIFLSDTTFINRIVLGSLLPESVRGTLPHFLQTWLRKFISGTSLYLLSGFLLCFYIYYLKRNVYIPKDDIPSKKAMLGQIHVAMKAMPWLTAFVTLSEYMIENGYTRCFARINDVGWLSYLGYLVIYLVTVEFGLYWAHREMHNLKPLYKYIHSTHHIYNKHNMLSPFAGLAFHPMDGLLQALPHFISLLVLPGHFATHIALIFVEGLWSASAHDCIDGKVWPVMGSGYHTIHHTTSRHNYGHYTIWMDWMFGTLRHPIYDPPKKM